MDEAVKILAFVGVITIASLACLLVACALGSFKEFIEGKRYDYQLKHRFDKPPTAKCYCKDCSHWHWEPENIGTCPEGGTCDEGFTNKKMADCWFCCFANPMTLEEKERRDKAETT
jgi:hypothetical protein